MTIADNSHHGTLIKQVRKNRGVLEILSEESTDRPSLAERADVSEKTIYRRVEKLEDLDIVQNHGNTISITTTGQLYLQRFRVLISIIETIDNHESVLDSLKLESLPPLTIFCSSTVVQPDTRAPTNIFEPAEETLNSAGNSRVYLPIVHDAFLRIVEACLNGDDELLIPHPTIKILETKFTDRYERVSEKTNIEIVDTDRPFFSVLVTEDPSAVLVYIYDEGGSPSLRLNTSGTIGVGWAWEFMNRL
jgi:predicted transcriptional regulator